MRRFALTVAAAAAVCGALGYGLAALATGDPTASRRIALSARKFDFDQSEIRIRKGEPVTLLIATSDFVHGFAIPDLNVRVDLVPGRTVAVNLKPERAGRFVFLCDNFCGEGHDFMSGVLTVTDEPD
jgi:cytochrome c oxidase subunit 2